MPNWCENVLTVVGKDVAEFDAKFKGKPVLWPLGKVEKYGLSEEEIAEQERLSLEEYNNTEPHYSFHALHPVPDEIVAQGFDMAGYNWCIANWGTKWNLAEDVMCEKVDDHLYVYHFDTAWGPPAIWLDHVAELFPELRFELAYHEPGMAFAGIILYSDGEQTTDIYHEVMDDRDSFMMIIEKHFPDDLWCYEEEAV